MANEVSIYTPRTMGRIISKIPPVHTFFRSTFFKNEETFTTVYNAQLFSAKVNNLNFIATLKIYSCQIYDNGTLVRNFIPVLRKSDNEIGMLDLVEGKFYTNAGTGKFTANLDTMYALIQGTPTVQDGRVSGFSSSNYLKLQEPIKPTGAFEIKLKFKISDNSKTNGLFHSSKTLSTGSGRFGFALVTASNGKLNFFASSDGSSWLFDKISASGLIQNNVDYYVKFGWTGTVYYVDLSTDDKIYNRVITYNSDVAVTQLIEYSSVGIYRAIDNIYPITNSIDLNRSYIKIDDTKYKLQAVVGWTKVGEPTIEDGVASGFSSSNYLQVNNALPTTIDNKYIFEGKTEITATTSGSYIFSFFCNAKSVTSVFGLLYRSSGYFAVVETNGTTVTVHAGTIAYQINTLYKYRVETDLNTYIRVYINDVLDISISLSYNNVHAYDGTIYYGIYPNGSVPLTNGTIDMNNTNIKINNKLWFNGLEQ